MSASVGQAVVHASSARVGGEGRLLRTGSKRSRRVSRRCIREVGPLFSEGGSDGGVSDPAGPAAPPRLVSLILQGCHSQGTTHIVNKSKYTIPDDGKNYWCVTPETSGAKIYRVDKDVCKKRGNS